MGGMSQPWIEANERANIQQGLVSPRKIEAKDLEKHHPAMHDGYLELVSAETILGMSNGYFYRIG